MKSLFFFSLFFIPVSLAWLPALAEPRSFRALNAPDLSFRAQNDAEYKQAISYVARETWKRSEYSLQLKRYTKKTYKRYVNRDARKMLGVLFPIIQIITDKEIKYEWEF